LRGRGFLVTEPGSVTHPSSELCSATVAVPTRPRAINNRTSPALSPVIAPQHPLYAPAPPRAPRHRRGGHKVRGSRVVDEGAAAHEDGGFGVGGAAELSSDDGCVTERSSVTRVNEKESKTLRE